MKAMRSDGGRNPNHPEPTWPRRMKLSRPGKDATGTESARPLYPKIIALVAIIGLAATLMTMRPKTTAKPYRLDVVSPDQEQHFPTRINAGG